MTSSLVTMCFIAGELPIEVSNAVPDSVMFQNEAPPLIPSREPNNDGSKSSETPPPIPLKSYKHSA